jgi:hypothetical protein
MARGMAYNAGTKRLFVGGGALRVYDVTDPRGSPNLYGYAFLPGGQYEYGVSCSPNGNLGFVSIFATDNGPPSLFIYDTRPIVISTTATTGAATTGQGTTGTTATTGQGTTGTTGTISCGGSILCVLSQWNEPNELPLASIAIFKTVPKIFTCSPGSVGHIVSFEDPQNPTSVETSVAFPNTRTPIILKNDTLLILTGDDTVLYSIDNQQGGVSRFITMGFEGNFVTAFPDENSFILGSDDGFIIFDLANLPSTPGALTSLSGFGAFYAGAIYPNGTIGYFATSNGFMVIDLTTDPPTQLASIYISFGTFNQGKEKKKMMRKRSFFFFGFCF